MKIDIHFGNTNSAFDIALDFKMNLSVALHVPPSYIWKCLAIIAMLHPEMYYTPVAKIILDIENMMPL